MSLLLLPQAVLDPAGQHLTLTLDLHDTSTDVPTTVASFLQVGLLPLGSRCCIIDGMHVLRTAGKAYLSFGCGLQAHVVLPVRLMCALKVDTDIIAGNTTACHACCCCCCRRTV
jgi:hypothetical protein